MANRPFVLNKLQVAYMLDVDERSITTYQKRDEDPLPMIQETKRGQDNMYNPADVVRWKVRQELSKLDVDTDGLLVNYEAERARKTRGEADAIEIKNEETLKQLIPRQLYELALADVSAQIGNLLDTIVPELKKKDKDVTPRTLDLVNKTVIKCRNLAANVKPRLDNVDTPS